MSYMHPLSSCYTHTHTQLPSQIKKKNISPYFVAKLSTSKILSVIRIQCTFIMRKLRTILKTKTKHL